MTNEVIQEQIIYYCARAKEYDEWFYRTGRYDRGLEINQRWFNEVAVLKRALHNVGVVKSVLELACGTGIWTQELIKLGERITAVDASKEMIEINHNKLNAAKYNDINKQQTVKLDNPRCTVDPRIHGLLFI